MLFSSETTTTPFQVKIFVYMFMALIFVFIFVMWWSCWRRDLESFTTTTATTTTTTNEKKYAMDMNRDLYIPDMPFTPHTILNSYDFVDTATTLTLQTPPDLDNINVPLEQNYKESTDHRRANPYKCFGKIEFTQKECEAPTDLVGNRVAPGVWDTTCVQNTDCPFYKGNQNYPNDFGKCLNGFCQMPKGAERIGFRQYNKNTLPLCYNCTVGNVGNVGKNSNIGPCCGHQRQPDYVFEDDLRLRYKHRVELAKKGLTTVTHDDNRQQFRMLEKKLKY